MAELSEQQIEQAAKAMHDCDWEQLKPDDKERYRTAACAAAPYLQLPSENKVILRLDKAVGLIRWIRGFQIVEQADRIDAFLAAHQANGGQDEPRI